jgi:transposase
MAVTRTGIPVRVWCWPGSTSDQVLIRQVNQDLRGWTLTRVIWVADRGFASAENRRWLRKGDHHYILGERLRSGSAEATAALSRQAATRWWPTTCGSRRCGSPTTSGSSSVTTPSRP